MNNIKQIVIALALIAQTTTSWCMQKPTISVERRNGVSSPTAHEQQQKLRQSKVQAQKEEADRIRKLQKYQAKFLKLTQVAPALRESRETKQKRLDDAFNEYRDPSFRPISRTPSPATSEEQSNTQSRSISRASESTQGPSPATTNSGSSTSMSPELVNDYLADVTRELLDLKIKAGDTDDFILTDDAHDNDYHDVKCAYSASLAPNNRGLNLIVDVRTQGREARHYFTLTTDNNGTSALEMTNGSSEQGETMDDLAMVICARQGSNLWPAD